VGRGSRARGGGRRGAQQLLELKREWGGRENGGSGAGAAWKEGNGREREGPRLIGRRCDSKLGLNRTKIQMDPNQFQIPSNFLDPNRTFLVSKFFK
jgi:hypothetical protein